MSFLWTEIDRLYAQALAQGRQGVIGLLVVRADRTVFAQRRSADRRLFPGCWDLVGGHIEAGETPREALVRELHEETGWQLGEVLGLRKVVDWESGSGVQRQLKREFVLAIGATGDLDHPQLEMSKVTEGRWFGLEQIEGLRENRPGSDTYVFDLVCEELSRNENF